MVTRERTEKGQISGSIYYRFTENNDIGQIVAVRTVVVQTVAGFFGGCGSLLAFRLFVPQGKLCLRDFPLPVILTDSLNFTLRNF